MRRPPERSIFTVPRPDPSRILQNLHALQPPLLARPVMLQHPPAPSPALAAAEVRLLAAPSPATAAAASAYHHPPTPSPSSIAYNSGGDDGSSSVVSPSGSSSGSALSADKDKEKALVILCFDITRWSARLQLLSLSFGIFFFFLINGYVEEYMFKRLPSFKFGAYLVVSCAFELPCLFATCLPPPCTMFIFASPRNAHGFFGISSFIPIP